MDYNARYYSPYLNRFISPDTIVPEPTSSGGFNRYRYARNNPLKFTDPTGHCEFDAETGEITRFDCSLEEFDALPIEDRLQWTRQLMDQVEGAEKWFNNIEGIIEGFVDYDLSKPGSWLSVVDAAILEGIQDGYAKTIGEAKEGIINPGAAAWQEFFTSLRAGANDATLISLWGTGEATSTNYGVALAELRGIAPDSYENLFLQTGDIYRSAAASFPGGLGFYGRLGGQALGAGNPVYGELGYQAGRFFNDPRSQVPVVGHSPVHWYSKLIWEVRVQLQ